MCGGEQRLRCAQCACRVPLLLRCDHCCCCCATLSAGLGQGELKFAGHIFITDRMLRGGAVPVFISIISQVRQQLQRKKERDREVRCPSLHDPSTAHTTAGE